jgi:hypothetical protein
VYNANNKIATYYFRKDSCVSYKAQRIKKIRGRQGSLGRKIFARAGGTEIIRATKEREKKRDGRGERIRTFDLLLPKQAR